MPTLPIGISFYFAQYSLRLISKKLKITYVKSITYVMFYKNLHNDSLRIMTGVKVTKAQTLKRWNDYNRYFNFIISYIGMYISIFSYPSSLLSSSTYSEWSDLLRTLFLLGSCCAWVHER